jgi:uncharacterized membrane protein YdjX (TVP38/TMEM64 family)
MKKTTALIRWLPLIVLILVLCAIFYYDFHHYFSFQALHDHHDFLLHWTQEHPLLAPLLFMAVATLLVSASFPVAVYLNITAGFLFGMVWGTVFAVIGAGLGAIIIFLAINTAFGHWLEERARGWVKEVEQGFQRNAFNYLLALRLIPIIPFWALNIAAALLNMRLKPYIVATFIGIIPETCLYAWMGNGLEQLFAAGQVPGLEMLLTPSTLIPLALLPILPLVPLIYKRFR